jgi:hypothetical protein
MAAENPKESLPATKQDLEALRTEILDRLDRLIRLQRAQSAFQEIDRIKTATDTNPHRYAETDVESVVDEVRTELHRDRTA